MLRMPFRAKSSLWCGVVIACAMALFVIPSARAATCAGGGLVGYYYSTPEVAVSACVTKAVCDGAIKDGTGHLATSGDDIREFKTGASAMVSSDIAAAIICSGAGEVCCMRENGIDNLCRTTNGGRCSTACVGSKEHFSASDNCTPSSDGTARHCCIPDAPKAAVVPGEVSCNGAVVRKTDDPAIACPKLKIWKDIDILKDSSTCGVIAYNAREEYRAMYEYLKCDAVISGTSGAAAGSAAAKPLSNKPLGPKNVQLPDPLNGANLLQVMANVVKAFLGTVGAFSLAVFVYAGVLYLISAGDAAQVTKAKDTMKNAVIGLVLIMGAYAITSFFIGLISV